MENIMWSLTGTGKSKRNFVSSSNQTCDHSTQGRPDYMRLDSSGQTIRDEDIPTVKPPGISTPASSTPDMAGHQRQNPHSHHTGKYSHRHTCNHLNQGRMGFHQTSTTSPNNHNNNYFANFNGHMRPHLYQAPRVPGFGYFPLAEKHNHHFNNYNLPFQFGTGTDYNFNPQPYPWSTAPRFKGQMISPQAVHTRTTPPPAQVMQNQHHHHHHSQRPAHQRNFHRQRQHGFQGPPNQQRNCDNNKRQKSYSQVKGTPSDTTKPQVAPETRAAAVKKYVTMENSTPETMSPPKVDSDVIINLKAMTISSDNMASGCIQVGATPEIKQSGNNDSASMSKSQQTSTGCPPTERKSVTVSVRSFFTPIQCTEKKTPGDKAVTADKTTESCDKSDQIEVEKPTDVPIKQKSGLQSELDVIKDTFLNCDNIDNENTDSGLGLEEERKENVEVPVRKNVHIGSFRIHAIYSPNNKEIQKSADDSLAGVHSSSPKPCASTETQEFSARVFLTPKTDCLAGAPARRKHRPSAKKRRRQRSQRSENQPCDAAQKKQTTQTGGASTSRGIPIPKPRKFEFYVDVSDSQDCESDVGSPSKASPEIKSSPQSPCISKFAFVIRPSEQYSDSESGSWTESDDDGFDSDDDDDDDAADGGDFDQDLWNSFNITCSFSSPLACLAAPVESASPTASALPDPPCSDTPDSEPRPCITEANQKWEKLYAHIDTDKPKPETPRKVLFAESSDLATVHVEESEMADAYRDARKGDWESYARDRCRFRSRVEAFQTLISPFHQSEHRASVYNRYHAE